MIVGDRGRVVGVLGLVRGSSRAFVGCGQYGGASADFQISAQLQFRDEFDAFVHRVRAVTFVGRSSNLRLAVLLHTLRDTILLFQPEGPGRWNGEWQFDPPVLDFVVDLFGDILRIFVCARPIRRDHGGRRAQRQVAVTVPNAVRRTLVVVVQSGRNRVDEVGIELPISWPQSGQGNDRLGRVTDMVGDVPHEPRVLGIRVPRVVELDVVGARCFRVRDLRLRLLVSAADNRRCAMCVQFVKNPLHLWVLGEPLPN